MVELKHKGIKIKIKEDVHPMNPRTEFDNLGTVVINHRRLELSDKTINPIDRADLDSTRDVIVPIYLFEHGGITIKTHPIAMSVCREPHGYIHVTEEMIKAEYNSDTLTNEIREKAYQVLEGEIKEYNSYLNGEVYQYEVEGEICGGFYDLKEARLAAEEVVDYIVSERRKKHYKKLKALIKAGVNIIYRETLSI